MYIRITAMDVVSHQHSSTSYLDLATTAIKNKKYSASRNEISALDLSTASKVNELSQNEIGDFLKDISLAFLNIFERNIFHLVFQDVNVEINVDRYLNACRRMDIFSVDIEKALKTYNFLLQLIKCKCAKNSSLVVKFLKTVCVTDILRCHVFVFEYNLDDLHFILHHSRQEDFNLWGTWQGSGPFQEFFNVIGSSIVTGNYESMESYLKMGFTYNHSSSVYNITCRTFCSLV